MSLIFLALSIFIAVVSATVESTRRSRDDMNASAAVNFGAHWASIKLMPTQTMGHTATPNVVWVDVVWRRRQLPQANLTGVVLTPHNTPDIITNIVRAPVPGYSPSEAMSFLFQPVLNTDSGFFPNDGTADSSIVTNCSGASGVATNPCWKAVDNVIEFSYTHDGEGWNANPGLEWLEFDVSSFGNSVTSGLGIWSMVKSEDQWYPVHDPAVVTVEARASLTDPWLPVITSVDAPTPDSSGLMLFHFPAAVSFAQHRYWRLTMSCTGANCHSWIKEIKFQQQQSPSPSIETNYSLFYLAHVDGGSNTGLTLQAKYIPVESSANATWLQQSGLTQECLLSGCYRRKYPQAQSFTLESTSVFESFAPMEYPATSSEKTTFLNKYPNTGVFFFAEDRRNQVKMQDEPVTHWINQTYSNNITLLGQAAPGETFAFQIGVWAARVPITLSYANVKWGPLISQQSTISMDSITSPNLGGIDYTGANFTQQKEIKQGNVGAVWFLIRVPSTNAGSMYKGSFQVSDQTFQVNLAVNVSAPPISNQGSDDLWRMSRLAWLDSTLGLDAKVTAPYTPVKVDPKGARTTVSIRQNNRTVTMDACTATNGFSVVDSMTSNGRPIISAPVVFAIEGEDITCTSVNVVETTDASTRIARTGSASNLKINSSIEINYDGYIEVQVAIQGSATQTLPNVSMTWEFPQPIAKYIMGLGHVGGLSSGYSDLDFNWKKDNLAVGRSQLWVGDPVGGLRIKWKGNDSDWNSPLHTMQADGFPLWAGDSQSSGGISVNFNSDGTASVTAFTGALTVDITGRTLELDMLITPVKEIDIAQHFTRDRYYQYGYNGLDSPADIASMGVKVLNLHQGVSLNPYINYPFDPEASLLMKNFSDTAKSLGVKSTCIYDTTRELSNRCYEMPTLIQIGTDTDHVFDNGEGGGGAWLQEHLQSNYTRRWSTGLSNNMVDAAVGDASLSRWVNYYVQGLSWLRANGPKIDGLYLDELSFDRKTMQRMRKAVDVKQGALFDLHSCNKFSCGDAPYAPHSSSMLIYAAHFAYLDSLWFGEGFNPNSSPEYWLIEMSGLAFGIPAEQLTRPNLWRGMVFGEGARPAPPLWKAWDALALTTPNTTMVGWWDDNCLANVSNTDVRATVYVVPSTTSASPSHYVLSIASWASTNVTVSVTLSPTMGKVHASAIAIAGFQPQQDTVDLTKLMITIGEGFLLTLTPATLN